MDFWSAFFLGLVQGLTEFFPVSSSGHLVILQKMIPGFEQPGVLFDTFLHGATLLAVLIYFHREISVLGLSVLPGKTGENCPDWSRREARKMVGLILIGTIPIGLVGLLLRAHIVKMFQTGWVVGPALMITALFLFLASRRGSGEKKLAELGLKDAIWIGLGQALALVPGISRSGVTIAAGMFLGLEGQEAVKFSFWLSLPAVMGAVLLESFQGFHLVRPEELIAYGAGFGSSLVAGVGAIGLVLAVVRRKRLRGFAWYCLGAGVAAIALFRPGSGSFF